MVTGSSDYGSRSIENDLRVLKKSGPKRFVACSKRFSEGEAPA